MVTSATICAALALTSCDAAVIGDPTPAPPTTSGRAVLPSDVSAGVRPKVGQCLDTSRATVVDCGRPHDAEVISLAQLPGSLPATIPDEPTITNIALPLCRTAMTGYLGGPDADATNLLAWAFWPNAQGWARGERWVLCTVTEVDQEDRPKTRTGSLRGALAGNGVYRFQTCSVGSPSRDAQLRKTGCDGEHLAEALPGVVGVGKPTDPLPHPDTLNSLAQARCRERLAQYLGVPGHPDVVAAWRIPNAESWSRGYTNVVCYAEARRPVPVRLRGLGAAPLPA